MPFAALLEVITELLRNIHAKSSLDVVMRQILRFACQLSGSIHGSFIQIDHETGVLQITSTFGPDWTDEKKTAHLRVGEGITGTVAASGKPYVCNDTLADPTYVQLFDYVRSEMAVPIFVDGRVWGIINIDGTQPGEYDEDTLREMTLFAELTASAINVHFKWQREQHLQQELMQADKMSSVGKLIAGIAHEINNPLTAIMGSASLLRLDLMDQEARRATEVIEQQAARASDLVKQLLSFSRKSAAKPWEVLAVNDVVIEACELVKPQLRLKNTTLSISVSKPSATVSGSKTKLQQVILNLITNGQQAIDERGKMDHRPGKLHVLVDCDNEWAHIQITDNGIGMTAEVRHRIFDPFFTTKSEGVGTGLGLSIVKEAIYEHRGRLTCCTQQGRGTTFTLSLPLATPVRETRKVNPLHQQNGCVSPHHRTTTPTQAFSTLIVDDEEPICYMLGRFFKNYSCNVVTTGTAEEAYELALNTKFDIIVSDVHLPGMSGLDLFQKLRDSISRDAKYILITGDIISAEVRNAPSTAGFTLVPKPFNPSDLLIHLPIALAS